MKSITISDKELQQIGLRLVEAAPEAKYIELTIMGDNVYLKTRYKDDTARENQVPLLREVEE